MAKSNSPRKKRTTSVAAPQAAASPIDAGQPAKAGQSVHTEPLDRIDLQIVALLQQRAKAVVEGVHSGDPLLLTPALKDKSLDRLAEGSPGPLGRQGLCAVFREIESACRAAARPTRVALLGPLFSYSHLAALHRFGRSVEFVSVGTISAVFEEVDLGQCDFGIVPVENSTDGRIADTLDMFTRSPARICGQVEMHIHHALLARCLRNEVKEVYSRPQALSQCRNWLAKHLPGARTIEVTSTTTAAQLAQEKPGAAAIASVLAGNEYRLGVLAEKIEDNPNNTTRFAVIGGPMPERTGNDHTAILFQLEHRPGTLSEAMNIFRRNKVNLTWIESFPLPGSDRIYLFFAEMEGHQTDARFRRAMTALGNQALRLEILGSFPAATAVD